MAALTIQQAALTGATPAYAAADVAGDTFDNDSRTMLHVKNGGGGSINVTVDSPTVCDQGGTHDLVVAVPAGQERIIGPFPVARFGSSVAVTYSGVTTVTVAAVRV